MVCPLRYIVAGVSILVAMLVLLWTNKESNKRCVRAASKKKSNVSRFVDLFTGRYLLDKWSEIRNAPAEEVVNKNNKPSQRVHERVRVRIARVH